MYLLFFKHFLTILRANKILSLILVLDFSYFREEIFNNFVLHNFSLGNLV